MLSYFYSTTETIFEREYIKIFEMCVPNGETVFPAGSLSRNMHL